MPTKSKLRKSPVAEGENLGSLLKLTKRGKHLLLKYGINEQQYTDLYDKQEGCCAVCKRAASSFRYRLAVDHDHKTGDIRGLLCIHCNRYVVGRHRRENGAELLKAAYDYLLSEYPGWVVPPKKKRKKRKKKWLKKS